MESETNIEVSQKNIDVTTVDNLEFQNILEKNSEETEKPTKKPCRILHFSDGVLEEFSTDDEEEAENKIISQSASQLTSVDTSTLTWGPWFWYQTIIIGSKTLEVCDYLGESLASFFGITSPKYQFEINHYNNMVEEEKQRQSKEDLEMGGWQNVKDDDNVIDALS